MTKLCGGLVDLRLGDWREALADVERCEAVITDPPYSARTHEGHGRSASDRGGKWVDSNGREHLTRTERRNLEYASWENSDVEVFSKFAYGIASGWVVAMTSHDLVAAYENTGRQQNRYVFPPLPFYSPGSRVRLSGDGPSSWTCWIVVSRPKTSAFARWGTLPGGYVFPPVKSDIVGAKPLGLMRAIVRDYTRPGDLVVDPFCGSGTTALACAIEGRRCITSELDPNTFEIARRRLETGFTPNMFE